MPRSAEQLGFQDPRLNLPQTLTNLQLPGCHPQTDYCKPTPWYQLRNNLRRQASRSWTMAVLQFSRHFWRSPAHPAPLSRVRCRNFRPRPGLREHLLGTPCVVDLSAQRHLAMQTLGGWFKSVPHKPCWNSDKWLLTAIGRLAEDSKHSSFGRSYTPQAWASNQQVNSHTRITFTHSWSPTRHTSWMCVLPSESLELVHSL